MQHVGGTVAARRLRVVGLLAVMAMTAACSPFSSSSPKSDPTVTTTTTNRPPPVVITKTTHTVKAGTTVQLGTAGQGAAELMKVGKPKLSRKAISSYAYGPEYGYYVTFPIKIFNDGKTPLLVERLDFWVDTAHMKKVNTNGGNSPESGAHTQLDTTELTTGQSVSNYLTFDVSTPHGRFVFGPGHKLSVAWSF
ncbi:MAG TPA: hypothetical protein VHV76_01505 [Mycobacteriales bacterium]|jgi:hypothetical protein|nr:hypothetical protein [Mycobacteriales bacterium]